MASSHQDWQPLTLQIHGGTIAAKVKGDGDNLLICFHGFGENRHAFDRLLVHTPEEWCILSFDLPLFGESEWTDPERQIDKACWEELITNIQDHFPQKIWHLLGFSMGGKIALLFQELLHRPAKTVILMAPDGLRRHPLHAFVSQTSVGKWLIRQMVTYPGPILSITELAFRLGWINRFIHLFMNDNFAEQKWRQRMYLCLRLYEEAQLDWEKLGRTALSSQWYLIWGRTDMTFGHRAANRLLRVIPHTQLYELNAGHMVLWDQLGTVRGLISNCLFMSSNSSQTPPT
ncbi:MAG: alpha/beta fold hydrolase [Bacteroidota bacterium]